jgi:hypothetical protein
MIKTYSEAMTYPTFEERFEYLKLGDKRHQDDSGYFRYLTQQFYRSREWHEIRNHVILRDNGCDLGFEDYPIGGRVYIHHTKVLTPEDFLNRTIYLTDPEFMITCSKNTHELIHYGGESDKPYDFVERREGDTLLW